MGSHMRMMRNLQAKGFSESEAERLTLLLNKVTNIGDDLDTIIYEWMDGHTSNAVILFNRLERRLREALDHIDGII